MKNSQKGFILLILLVVLVVIAIGSWYYVSKINTPTITNISHVSTQTGQLTQKPPSIAGDIAILDKKIASSTDPVEKADLIKERAQLQSSQKTQQANYELSIKQAQAKANASQQQNQTQSPNKKIGDSFTLWGIEYRVISAANFTPFYDFKKTTGKYIGVKIMVTNLGKTESAVNVVYVKDGEGRQYNSAMLGYQQLGVADYGEAKVQAGIPETDGVIFEVAKDSSGLQLVFPASNGQIAAQVSLGI